MNLFLFLHLVFVTLLLRAEAQAKTCCKHCSCQAQCALFIVGVTSLWQLLSTSIVLGLTWLAVLSGLTSRWTAIRCLTTIGSIAALVCCLARIKLLVGDIDRHVLVIWRNRNFWNGCRWFVTRNIWYVNAFQNDILWPWPIRYFTGNLINRSTPRKFSLLRDRLRLAIWRRDVDRPRNRLVQIILGNAAWVILTRVVWQYISWRLWIVWRNNRRSVREVVLEVLVNFGILIVGRTSSKDIVISIVLVKDVTLLFEFLNDFIWILGKADRFISLASCKFTRVADFLARCFIIEDGLSFLRITNINDRLDNVFWIWRNGEFVNLLMVWRVAFNRWTSYSCKRLAVSLLAVNRPWIVGNNLAGNAIGRVATLEGYCCRVVWLNSLVVFVNVVNRFRNRLLIRIFVGCARVCRAMLEVNFIGWRADTRT